MQRAAIASVFVDEPVVIGSVQLIDNESNRYQHDLVLESISLGSMERICSILAPVVPLLKDMATRSTDQSIRVPLGEILINSLYNLSKVIVMACDNSPKLIDEALVDAVHTQFSLQDILGALKAILSKVSFRELSEHFQFMPSAVNSSYPGSNSFWALLVNAMVSFKGCNEYDLKWNMSYTNLLMYCSVLSASRLTDSGGGETTDQLDGDEPVDMFDLFNRKIKNVD